MALKHGDTAGIVSAMKQSFQAVNIPEMSFERKLVGFAADGASVNHGDKDAVICLMKSTLPWVIYICFGVVCGSSTRTLRNDALKGTVFDDVDDVLLHLYYLYENSPKEAEKAARSSPYLWRILSLNLKELDQNVFCFFAFLKFVRKI